MSTTRMAVVGVGHHGQHHARILAQIEDVELVALVDVNEEAARSVAEKTGAVPLSDHRSLPTDLDGVCVCVPTAQHGQIAREFLGRGIATLVEKPLAPSVDEAGAMVRLARRAGALLQVGHIERFNPAWRAIERLEMQPHFFEAQRLSPDPKRSRDVSAVFDVMIHDLDLALSLFDAPVASVTAVGTQVLGDLTDLAAARVTFADGRWANFCASRVHHKPIRSLRLWEPDRLVEANLLDRTTVLHPLGSGQSPQALPLGDGHTEEVEPLRLELEEFVRCIRDRSIPRVTGEAGYAAVVLAAQIDRCIRNASSRSLRRSA